MNKALAVAFMYCVASTHCSSVHLNHSTLFPLFCSPYTSPQLCTRGEQAKFSDTNSLTWRCTTCSCGTWSHYHPPCPELGQQVWNMHCPKIEKLKKNWKKKSATTFLNRPKFHSAKICNFCINPEDLSDAGPVLWGYRAKISYWWNRFGKHSIAYLCLWSGQHWRFLFTICFCKCS